MALAKHRTLEGSQACSIHGGGQSIQELNPPPLELFRYKGHSSMMLQEGESSDSLWSYSSSLLPFLSDPTNSASTDYVLGAVNSLPREALSPINYSATTSEHWAYLNTSVLSFDQGEQGDRIPRTGYLNLDLEDDECAAWIDAMDESYQLNHLDIKRRSADSRLIKEEDCFEVESGYGLIRSPVKDKRQGQDRFGLMYPGAATVDGFPESMATVLQKRSYMDACDMQSPKKQYCGNTRKIKEKSSPSKDPQSIAAKNRRERISERLKILQDLVPNGTKVDLVTMLEKAISYVKFLQLQVKVLATDEFWPAQGGKAPDVGQVKEAIDAILSSQRDRNSSSKQ